MCHQFPFEYIRKYKYNVASLVIVVIVSGIFFFKYNKRVLTEREGRTGEYWPEVVAVRTKRSEVRTATTEGQYSLERPEQARLVSCLLYGTLFLVVWHSVFDSKMELQKRFATESDKSNC